MSVSTKPSNTTSFQKARKWRFIERTLQVCLCLLFAAGINYTLMEHFIRVDLTQSKERGLSPESKEVIRQLEQKVQIYILMSKHDDEQASHAIYEDISKLLREYTLSPSAHKSGGIDVHFIDIYAERSKALEVAQHFQLKSERAIIVSAGDKTKIISGMDLYDLSKGQGKALFLGEQVFTEAILDVTSSESVFVYFLQGHGELDPNSTDPIKGLSLFADQLKLRNIKWDILDITQSGTIPERASMLILAAPQVPVLPEESALLKQYLNKNHGRMIVFTEPGKQTGLDDLFYDWGVLVDSMVAVATGDHFNSEYGNIILGNYNEHPILRFLIEQKLTVLAGLTRSVREDIGAPEDKTRTVTPLIATAGPDPETRQIRSWAESDWRHAKAIEYTPSKDLPGPVSIAVVSERSAGSELGLNIPGGKLMVFGNADMVSNNLISELGNQSLFSSSVDWMLDRSSKLGIPPKQLREYKITLARNDLYRMAIRFSILPLLILIIGIVLVYARRR